ncbi:MAG: hypothetical protein ABIJ27_07095 [Candidatus Omnitrophota bacterium]
MTKRGSQAKGAPTIRRIIDELREHMPFTIVGALSGIVVMVLFRNISPAVSYKLFYVFHPLHVVLSALVTASIFELHQCKADHSKCNLPILLFVGYVGSVGIATLSDSLIPYLGEFLLGMPHRHAHIGFIEEWWLVNPLAILGIAIAYFRPSTKFPHAGHVLVSTWASLFHVLMARGEAMSLLSYIGTFFFLFIAVWLPCCISDIVFPLLFVKDRKNIPPHRH